MANIIGDIAGNYNTLMALLKKMPNEEVISVGDMIDRGPRSKEVVQWFMKNGTALLGNHEHMLIKGREGDLNNAISGLTYGGIDTLKSFVPETDTSRLEVWVDDLWDFHEPEVDETSYYKELVAQIPEDVIAWMKSLPIYIQRDGLFISHAPKNPTLSLAKAADIDNPKIKSTLIWNRGSPRRMKDMIQIFGHNADHQVEVYKDKLGIYAYCIDTSKARVLTGMHWPTMKIYEQEIID